MKLKLNSWNKLTTNASINLKRAQPGLNSAAADAGDDTPDVFELNRISPSQFTPSSLRDNFNSLSDRKTKAARQRFFAKHGPTAEIQATPLTAKEIRKALVNAEMAIWESF